MERKEAIEIWLPIIAEGVKNMPECEEAFNMAFNSLKTDEIYNLMYEHADVQEISTGSTTKNDLGVDAISREDALMCLTGKFENREYEPSELISIFSKRIKALSSVTPQEPRIITCKDCKYYRNKGNKRSYCTKRLNVDSVTDRYREPNFYCADAVLREVVEE